MEKPSKKLYPDYYQVIAEPIDMLAIEANIKAEKYQSENELIQDFKVFIYIYKYNINTIYIYFIFYIFINTYHIYFMFIFSFS